MEAANRGAFEAGAPTIGFNITLPREQEPNRFTTPALTFRFHYFAMRKMHFAMRAKALVVFPGGFGTFDELFELVTLVADGQGAGDADRAGRSRTIGEKWSIGARCRRSGMVGAEDLGLLGFAADAADAWAILEGGGNRRRRADFSPQTLRTTCLLAGREKGANITADSSSSVQLRRRTVSQNEPNCGRNLSEGSRPATGCEAKTALFSMRRPRGPIERGDRRARRSGDRQGDPVRTLSADA